MKPAAIFLLIACSTTVFGQEARFSSNDIKYSVSGCILVADIRFSKKSGVDTLTMPLNIIDFDISDKEVRARCHASNDTCIVDRGGPPYSGSAPVWHHEYHSDRNAVISFLRKAKSECLAGSSSSGAQGSSYSNSGAPSSSSYSNQSKIYSCSFQCRKGGIAGYLDGAPRGNFTVTADNESRAQSMADEYVGPNGRKVCGAGWYMHKVSCKD